MQDNQMEKDLTKVNEGENALTEPNRTEPRIIVIGSLKPEKAVQDRVRVLSGQGICQALRATDYKDPPKVVRRFTKK